MKRIFTAFVLSLLTVTMLYAGTTGKIAGTVTDNATGEPLPFVNVIVMGTTLGAATDINGNYVILNVPPGTYEVKAQYIGFQTIVKEGVRVSVDLTTTVDFVLGESSVELEEIVVQAEAEKLKKDITSSESRVTSEDIQNLPVAELNDVISLQSGVTRDAGGGFHIRGGRSSEIAYWVNGVSITDAFDNSRGIEIDNSSVQELQVISGTFNAEYGNAMSGIINTITKEGGTDYHGNIKLYSSDYLSDFTEYFTNIDDFNPVENYNIQASLDGPIPFTNNKLKFFVNGRYVYDDGHLYGYEYFLPTGEPGDSSAVSMSWDKRIISQANLSYWLFDNFKLQVEGLFSKSEWMGYSHDYKWQPRGVPTNYNTSINTTFSITHMLGSATYYDLKFNYFDRNYERYLYEDPYDPRYLHPDSLSQGQVAYDFRNMGTDLYREDRTTNTLMAKMDFTSQVSQAHLIKFGLEGKIHKINYDSYSLEPKRVNGEEVTPFEPQIPQESSFNRTLYEEEPIEFSAYIQDKIELESVIINLGLRFDYFDSRGNVLVDPTDPNIFNPLRNELDDLSIEEREPYFYKKAEAKYQISPRFGIAYPISATGVLHFSYGHFLQIPSFQYLFARGSYKVPETGQAGAPFGNPDLDAQKTVMYELGFRQEFADVFLLDVTGFYRDIRSWITSGPIQYTRNLASYSIFVNKDYSNVRGITLTFSKSFSNFYSFDVNYTFQYAEGSNSSPEEEYWSMQGNAEPTKYLLPLDWDQRHLVNFNFYFGGESWGSSILMRYGTGLPYTPSITQYVADRGVTSGLQKNSRFRPAQFNVDLKLHKMFTFGHFRMTAFLRVFNVFDAKNVVNVFGDTGEPDFTTEAQNLENDDPNRPNTIEEYMNYPWHYAEPRQIQAGIELNF